ncbi:hypothetical protein U9M48_003314 [Paspalum notatum var. saurae]|uniref:Uncharacterized protein n=1 Tax=Paspalum notatum var. saurae TaxID=547442 RepID=A0AAQ3SI38_PASNO
MYLRRQRRPLARQDNTSAGHPRRVVPVRQANMLPLRGCASAQRSLKNSRHRPPTVQYSSSIRSSCRVVKIKAKALRSLHQKTYALTKCFDEDLLIDTGMREEFNEVFQAVGWSDFAEIPEGGIVLLTKEFLMTLRTDTRRDARARSRTKKK